MERIGFIAAMKAELDTILDEIEDLEEETTMGIKFYIGRIFDKEIVASLSGIGKVNAAISATLLVNEYKCDFIFNTGVAGGVTPLQKEDVIIANKLTYHDFDLKIFGYKHGQVPQLPQFLTPSIDAIVMVKRALNKLNIRYKEATVFSGDSFVTSIDTLKDFDDKAGATDMESTAIAQVCTRAGVEFMVLRYLSDVIGEENQAEEYDVFEERMAERSAKITLELFKEI